MTGLSALSLTPVRKKEDAILHDFIILELLARTSERGLATEGMPASFLTTFLNVGFILIHQLIDLLESQEVEWKMAIWVRSDSFAVQYAVSSSSLSAINKPLLRLELCVSETPDSVKEPVMAPTHQTADDKTLFLLVEYDKSELQNLISEMEAIEKALDESPAN